MIRAFLMLMGVGLGVSACTTSLARAPEAAAPARESAGATEWVFYPAESAGMTPETAAAMQRMLNFLPEIHEIRAAPAEIEMDVGELFDTEDSLRILAFDSDGKLLGRLPLYNQVLQPGAAELRGTEVIGVRRGVSVLRVVTPLWDDLGGSGPAPEVHVFIHVQERRPPATRW